VSELRTVLAAGSAALALAIALAGCALPGAAAGTSAPPPTGAATAPSPPSTTHHRPATSAALIAQANRSHEYPTPASAQTVIGGWRSPGQAVQVFADTYINWTAATVSARLAALAEVSVGQARSAMLLAASDTARDYELRHSGVANRGTVEAVAPLPSAPHQYVVVTQERTTSATAGSYPDLAPAWHVTLATVTSVTGGLWVLTRWQPES
jgi:hypothetical protein